MSVFEGKGITHIKYNKKPGTNETISIELWQPGGVVTVTDKKDIDHIEEILTEGNRLNERLKKADDPECQPFRIEDYLAYQLEEEGW